MDVLGTSSLVVGSCCGCMTLVEWLSREDPGCMNLMTFSTFITVALEGFVFGTHLLQKKNSIPIHAYLKIVVTFFAVSVVNNQALNFNIPVPLHIIFRSGSLVTNLLLGRWLLNRRYSPRKYLSVMIITGGIIICTLATSKGHGNSRTTSFDYRLLIGIGMLTFALIFSSVLGILQEQLYTKYGKHPQEAMFYVHALSLPAFLLMWGDIVDHMKLFSNSEPVVILSGLGLRVPKLWLLLILCDLAQYFCIRFVYELTAMCSTLTVTLVITLRKFFSLLISVVYFRNSFTVYHWIGTVLVFFGTFLFLEPPPSQTKVERQKKD